MNTTIGSRIAALRKSKGLKQEELAEMLGVSGQAVSKWENDQNCPDISLLPQLAKILGVTVDELLSGKPKVAAVQLLPQEERRSIQDMMLKMEVDSHAAKVRINLPIALIQVALECGMEIPQVSGNDALKQIDWQQILTLVSHGVIGNLMEVETESGDTVRIFVE